jgi:hypothetical protein
MSCAGQHQAASCTGASVALEVDGPSHFLQNGQEDGRTRMR